LHTSRVASSILGWTPRSTADKCKAMMQLISEVYSDDPSYASSFVEIVMDDDDELLTVVVGHYDDHFERVEHLTGHDLDLKQAVDEAYTQTVAWAAG
jgi:hypothetical protein